MPRLSMSEHIECMFDARLMIERGDTAKRERTMAVGSSIEWTEVTWNPVTGCDRVAAGCDNCYALALAKRLKAMGVEKYSKDGDPRTSGPGFGVTIHPRSLAQPLGWRTPKIVFVNSMSDLFHARVPVSFIQQIFDVMADTPQHTYQALTKRAHRMARVADRLSWPPNLWMGVSVESAEAVDRIDSLRAVPARTRFLSCEPLLTPLPALPLNNIDWVIVGGESGPAARPMDADWAADIRDQCVEAGVAFFFKQWGGRTPKANGRELDGRTWDEMPRLAAETVV
jgi:protein gp37